VTQIRCRIKEYIQPFERILAVQELTKLAGNNPQHLSVDAATSVEFGVDTSTSAAQLAGQLAYWEGVTSGSDQIVTAQSLRESTVNVVRNGIDLSVLRETLPFSSSIPLPNRRCLRYGTHGIHEYRGKFFPQLVRALINISGTKPGGIVVDPMSGSGTTAVEAALMGCQGFGLDMNPLSTLISNVKCELLSADVKQLEATYQNIRDLLLRPETHGRKQLTYFASLPELDQKYLKEWFAPDVLIGLDEIAILIQSASYLPAKKLMWVSLSNILRSVSWQKNEDLRVRKDIRFDVEIDPKKEFLEELGRSIRAVLAFLYQEQYPPAFKPRIDDGDARQCASHWRDLQGKVDVVITSPPYATALPYLDTDRLSLCYLGLLPRPEHRKRDILMIGNREVSERMRLSYLNRLKSEQGQLPAAVIDLIRKIGALNDGTDAGFRRRNLPALLANYFFDMRDVLSSTLKLLKPGATAFVVVGNNHTVAGGTRVEIMTANLLAEISQNLGFEVQPSIPMDMLASRDIFRKNAMATEEILRLRKPL
jgi:DNA modification methylase